MIAQLVPSVLNKQASNQKKTKKTKKKKENNGKKTNPNPERGHKVLSLAQHHLPILQRVIYNPTVGKFTTIAVIIVIVTTAATRLHRHRRRLVVVRLVVARRHRCTEAAVVFAIREMG